MFNRLFAATLLTITSLTTYAEIPDVNDFRIVPQFPQPAEGAYGVVGTATSNGRFIFWDGDTVFLQDEAGSDELTPIASGYAGDPGFVALAPNGRTLLMGAGFTPAIYLLDIDNPEDFEEGDAIDAPSHFSGGFLNADLIILDRSTDDFASELVVLSLDELTSPDSLTRATPSYQTIMKFPVPSPETRATIIDKPEFSYSGKIFINQNRSLVYAMDSNTKELRSFRVSDLIDAFKDGTMLDWTADGEQIGETGDFFTGGVIGENPDGELLIDGSDGYLLPGGIMYVDSDDPAFIIATLDPAGTEPFYFGIYNRSEDELIAIDSTFGEPLRAYARETGIAPVPARNPCDSFLEIFEQWIDFSLDLGLDPLTADLDGDGIPDNGALLLLQNMSCGNEFEELRIATNVAYDLNLDTIDDELLFEAIEDYRELIAAIMAISLDMQSAVTTILSDDGIALAGTYLRVTCTNGECLPDFEEKDIPLLLVTTRSTNEPYSGSGDLDEDGTTNLEEYNNVIENGGDVTDYALAAATPKLDGSSTLERHASNSGCFIATAAYGTPLAGEIGVLREMRDSRLMTNPLGALFVDTYYRISPPVADQVAQNQFLRNAVQVLLKPVLILANVFNSSQGLIILGLASVLLCFTLRIRRRKVTHKTSF